MKFSNHSGRLDRGALDILNVNIYKEEILLGF